MSEKWEEAPTRSALSPQDFADRLQRTAVHAPPPDHSAADLPAPFLAALALTRQFGVPGAAPALMPLAVDPPGVLLAIRRPLPFPEIERRLPAAVHTVLPADVLARGPLVGEVE